MSDYGSVEYRVEIAELDALLRAKRVVAMMVRDGLLTEAQGTEFSRRLREQRLAAAQPVTPVRLVLPIVKVMP